MFFLVCDRIDAAASDSIIVSFNLSESTYSAWSVIFLLSLKQLRTGNTVDIGMGLIAAASPDIHLSNSLVLLKFMYKILHMNFVLQLYRN
jgi:hypothetical protein